VSTVTGILSVIKPSVGLSYIGIRSLLHQRETLRPATIDPGPPP
jgi:hypothetical protein